MTQPAKGMLTGHPPSVKVAPQPDTYKITGKQVKELLDISDEQLMYQKCWNIPEYRKWSPGEGCVEQFLEAIDRDELKTLIDFGCGTGRAGYKLWQDGQFDVTLMDFAWNCLDANIKERIDGSNPVQGLTFVEHDITKKTALKADYGYCCDVMEHIPEDQVDDVLETILTAATDVFFQICTTKDHFGNHPDINHPLHVCVHGYQWWLKKLMRHGVRIHRSLERPGHVIFFVSGYTGFSFDKLTHNTNDEIVHKQIRQNCERGLKQVMAYEEQADQKVVVLGGGPSLNDYVDEIRAHKEAGAKIITMNNTYAWAKENDLWPVTQFMVDARPFNKRFVEPTDEENLYIIAAQVHPQVFDLLPEERTMMMHCNLDDESIEIINEVVGECYKDWMPIPGGSSIMLRTLPCLQQLGFRDVEIYGFDSCLIDSEHHAYEQKENDTGGSNHDLHFKINDRSFSCHPWMLSQAKEFIEVKSRLLAKMDIKVHGDGLIAYLLETGAEILEE